MNGGTLTRAHPRALETRSRAFWFALAGGAITGIVYALSPLTVVFALAVVPLFWWARHGLQADERRRVTVLLAVALALRLAAVVALLVTANPRAGSFATFFGDEEFYTLRGLRLYNIWMDIPIPRESFLYAYDLTGYSGYQELLVLLQIVFGPAPYGLHLVNIALYVAGAILLFHLVRPAYGPAAALVAFAGVLFLPSLFMWSISALKESLFLALTAGVLAAAVKLPRRSSVVRAAGYAVAIAAGAGMIELIRPGGAALTLGGIAVGYLARFVTLRRVIFATAVMVALLSVPLVLRSSIPLRVQDGLESAARYHRGHVFTPGHSFKLMDQRFYSMYWGPLMPPKMSPVEDARYLVRAVVNFVGQPFPWDIQSRAELAFLPEQAVWYLIVLLAPIGLVHGWRRDALLTSVLGGYACLSSAVIAVNSGNIGTLVRHRALVLPFLIWTSALGLIALLASRRTTERPPDADYR